jgi:ornithine cyclodeaminase
MIVVDNLEQCQENARELNDAFAQGLGGGWDRVQQLSQVVKAGKVRPASVDLTLYKFMGVGLADLAAGIEIYRRAQKQGKGTPREHAVRFPVDLS